MKRILLIVLVIFSASCSEEVDLCETNNCFVVKRVMKVNSPLGFWQSNVTEGDSLTRQVG